MKMNVVGREMYIVSIMKLVMKKVVIAYDALAANSFFTCSHPTIS